jgi:hypothetical protein
MENFDTTSYVESILGTFSIISHPLCVRTKKKGEIATSAPLRALLLALLPDDHEARPILTAWAEHTTAYGNISKYTAPLLYRRRTNCKQPFDSILLPQPTTRHRNPAVQITYPRWYMVPGAYKDDSSDRGGQKQARPSAQAPQAQQFPPEIFACICSRYLGGSIIGPDLSQIELRTAALLSGDESLVQNYREGRDLHTDRAVYIFGPSVTSEPTFKSGLPTDKRQWSKTLNFEDLYMAGPAKMQQKLLEDSGIIYPLSFFEEVVRSRRELRPGLVEWQRGLIQTVERQGYLELPITGHGRTFFGGIVGSNKVNEVVNFPVQAFAALTMRDIALTVCDNLPPLSHPDPPIVFFMDRYDACYIDCKPGYEEEARSIYADAVRRCDTTGLWGQMQDLLGREVPLKYDMKTLSPPPGTLP